MASSTQLNEMPIVGQKILNGDVDTIPANQWASHRKQAWMDPYHQKIAFLKAQIQQQKQVGCNSTTINVFAISCFCKSIESCSNLPPLNHCWNYSFGEFFKPLFYSSCLEIKWQGRILLPNLSNEHFWWHSALGHVPLAPRPNE
jgi:hypothetical protein